MKSLSICLIVLTALTAGLPAVSGAADECFVIIEKEQGTFCEGDPSSLSVTLENTCDSPWVLSVCIEQKNGHWKCGLEDAVFPDEKRTFGACNATGEIKHAHCYRTKGCDALKLSK